ncbi:MAG TPA: flagellar protein FliS [Lacipirellulaceae bacterium]|nr:flagellar protein FliS [Lacipirellulaceae bacterium]
MNPPASTTNRYLDGRVATASQPELQLLLLDGALRFGRQARQIWDDASQSGDADRLVGRTLDILEELVRSVAGSDRAEANRLEEEYAFAFRQLTAAQLGHDGAMLDGALELLAFQRETWRLACEKLRSQPMPKPNLDFGPTPAAGFSFQA